jgi:hypothetical protein
MQQYPECGTKINCKEKEGKEEETEDCRLKDIKYKKMDKMKLKYLEMKAWMINQIKMKKEITM